MSDLTESRFFRHPVIQFIVEQENLSLVVVKTATEEVVKLTNYQALIKRLLTQYVEADNQQLTPGVEYFLIADDESGTYIWLNLGWFQRERLNAPTVDVRLKNGKIWIEENWTEVGIAKELLQAGVPKEDIVLAFQHPEERRLTEFATS